MPLEYKKIQEILKNFDFILTRTRGSHARYEKDGYWVTVWYHKEYPPKTAQSMLRDIAKISWVEYKDLLKEYNIKL